jgi:galactokinase
VKTVHPDKLARNFERIFDGEPVLYRAPGRVNLIGEHTDYNDGLVMPMNTALYTWAAVSPRSDRQVRAHSTLFDETFSFDLEGIEPGDAPAWAEYLKGVAGVLQAEGHDLRGADILIDGEIPLGGGLSSSASLEAAVGVALLGNAGRRAGRMDLALMCQRAEHEFAGVPCGIMDQAVITACPRRHAMMLDCRSLESRFIPLPEKLCLLVVDSGVKHELGDGGYRQRREECERALDVLRGNDPSVASMRDVTLALVDRCETQLGGLPYRRARHVVTEIQRVVDAAQAIATDDLEALGAILDASHASLRDDFMVSCAELDFLVHTAGETPGVYGSRMVGGGFGGCTLSLVDPDCLEDVRGHILRAYQSYAGSEPWHHVVRSAGPAGRYVKGAE